MKLPAVPVESFEDITLDMETLQTALTTPKATLPFLQLGQAGALQLALGDSAVTFSTSTTSASITVTHNIGRVPIAILATSATVDAIPMVALSSTITTATLRGEYWSAISGTFPFSWIAIG